MHCAAVRGAPCRFSNIASRITIVCCTEKINTLVVFLLMSTTVPQLEPASEPHDQASQQTKEQ
jgi:hypothetical protein